MTQVGRTSKIEGRSYEDYQSLHKALRFIHREKAVEIVTQYVQLSTAAVVEVSNKGTTPISITYIGKTETNLQVDSSAADAGLAGAIITAHYKDASGVAHTATIASAIADMSGTVDFDTPVTDFYCWDQSLTQSNSSGKTKG